VFLGLCIGDPVVKPIKWIIGCVAVMAAMSVSVVNAQEGSLIVPSSSSEKNDNPKSKRPHSTFATDDLFRDPNPSGPTASNTQQPVLPSVETARDPFGQSHATGQTRSSTSASGSKHSLCKCEGEGNAVAITRIEQALGASVGSAGLEFADSPLEEVASYLQDRFGLPIQIDTVALEQNGINAQEPVTTRLSNISVRSALRLILKPLQLTYIIENEVLMITTAQEADSRIRTCVYDVRDLIDDNPQIALKELTDVITSGIKADSWDNNGSGRVRSYPPNLLVIAQTQEVHERVRNLLGTMRQMRQAAREADKAPGPKE
jgi:hypothetical protein